MNKAGDYSKNVYVAYDGEDLSGNKGAYSYSGSSPSAKGSFIITKVDPLNQIISGTFSFTLRESNSSGKTIEITDGRFDFKMNACICR